MHQPGQYGPPPSHHAHPQQQQQGYGPPPGPHGQYGYYAPQQPVYAAPPARKSTMTLGAKIGLGFIAMFMGCGVLSGIGNAASKAQASTTQAGATPAARPAAAAKPTPAAKPSVSAQAVSAMALWKDYQANEVAADEDYKGKLLDVTGEVTKIDKDFMDDIIVNLRSGNQFMSTHAYVDDSEKRTAARLSKGETVTLRCQGGGMIIGSPVLRECTFKR